MSWSNNNCQLPYCMKHCSKKCYEVCQHGQSAYSSFVKGFTMEDLCCMLQHVQAIPTRSKRSLDLYPESEYIQALNIQDEFGWNALHCAVNSNNMESIKFVLGRYPESERLRAVSVVDKNGCNILHCAAYSDNHESMNVCEL